MLRPILSLLLVITLFFMNIDSEWKQVVHPHIVRFEWLVIALKLSIIIIAFYQARYGKPRLNEL